MKSVRVQPEQGGNVLLVDVVCNCGSNGLTNVETGEASYKHNVRLGEPAKAVDTVLRCRCGKSYRLHPQKSHLHVFDESAS